MIVNTNPALIAGIVTTDATIVLADCSAARSIIRFQDEVDKIKQLDSHKVNPRNSLICGLRVSLHVDPG